MSDRPRIGHNQPPPLKAYHGTPYDFEKFLKEKIGTGEGAQAYGHGLYFAEKRGIAEHYRDAITDRHSGRGHNLTNFKVGETDAEKLKGWVGKLWSWHDRMRKLDKMGDSIKRVENLIERNVTVNGNPLNEEQAAGMDEWLTAEKAYAADLAREVQEDKSYVDQTADDFKIPQKWRDAITNQEEADLVFKALNGMENDRSVTPSGHFRLALVQVLAGGSGANKYLDDKGNTDHQKMYEAEQAHKDKFLPLFQSMVRVKADQDPGRLYEVNLHAGDHELLDWDENYKDQHPEVISKLKALDLDKGPFLHNDSGNSIYRTIGMRSGGAPAASKALLNAGIKGIRYRDAGSRKPQDVFHVNGSPADPNDGFHSFLKSAYDEAGGTRASSKDIEDLLKEKVEDAQKAKDRGDRFHGLEVKQHVLDQYMNEKPKLEYKKERGTYNYVIFDPRFAQIMKKYDRNNQLIADYGVHLKEVDHDPFAEEDGK